MKCERAHLAPSVTLLQTVQRVVNPEEGMPYTEWLCPDRVTFTQDARAPHYAGDYVAAERVAREIAERTGTWVFSVDVEAPVKPSAPTAPLSRFARSHSLEHLAGRPKRRADLDARDLRESERHAIYD